MVTVGHQLVIGGGPAFFHHKILTAIRVAKRMSSLGGSAVVPLFWMASEDHDWKEVSSLSSMQGDHTWEPNHADVPFPVGSRSLDGVEKVIRAWGEAGATTEEWKLMVADVQTSQAAGESLAGVMRRWLHRWYGDVGLMVLDPMNEELKKSASVLWEAEFEGRGVHAALKGSPEAEGPALVRENNVFWLDHEHGRIGVVRDPVHSVWRAGNLTFPVPEGGWSAWSRDHAEACSPGVLLRPLYQEWLLHSAAVIVGPGEWRYWHQLPAAFTAHGLEFPALRMRDHAVVLSPEVCHVGWQLEDGWMNDEEWDRWVLDRWMVEHDTEVLGMTRAMESWLEGVQGWTETHVPSAAGTSGALEAATLKSWSQWLKKVRRAVKGQRAEEWAAARRACGHLTRRGVPQDRWANWHALAGTEEVVHRWREVWLDDEGGLVAQVWRFGPLEGKSPSSD